MMPKRQPVAKVMERILDNTGAFNGQFPSKGDIKNASPANGWQKLDFVPRQAGPLLPQCKVDLGLNSGSLASDVG
jgi:hypothetical protein